MRWWSCCWCASVLPRRKRFCRVVHAVDILWPVLISLFATAQRGPFFLFFVFVMAAAAYRWGLWETVGTAAAAVALLWTEALVVRAGLEPAADRWLRMVHLPRLGMSVAEPNPQQLFMSSVYLIVLGLLLGYMSENQKKARAECSASTRVLSSTRVRRDDGDPAANSWRGHGHLRRSSGAQRLAGKEQLPGVSRRGRSRRRGHRSAVLARGFAGKPKRCICSSRRRTRFTRRAAPTVFPPCCSIATACACATSARNFWMRWREWKNLTPWFRWPCCSGPSGRDGYSCSIPR